jgi:hypothetical protein
LTNTTWDFLQYQVHGEDATTNTNSVTLPMQVGVPFYNACGAFNYTNCLSNLADAKHHKGIETGVLRLYQNGAAKRLDLLERQEQHGGALKRLYTRSSS